LRSGRAFGLRGHGGESSESFVHVGEALLERINSGSQFGLSGRHRHLSGELAHADVGGYRQNWRGHQNQDKQDDKRFHGLRDRLLEWGD
jgi:hypothetical protein